MNAPTEKLKIKETEPISYEQGIKMAEKLFAEDMAKYEISNGNFYCCCRPTKDQPILIKYVEHSALKMENTENFVNETIFLSFSEIININENKPE